jgi:hypothetical protein
MPQKFRMQSGYYAFLEVGFPILFHLIEDRGETVEELDWVPSTKLMQKLFPSASYMIGNYTHRDMATKRFTQHPDGDCLLIKESSVRDIPKTKAIPNKLFEFDAKNKGLYFVVVSKESLKEYMRKVKS